MVQGRAVLSCFSCFAHMTLQGRKPGATWLTFLLLLVYVPTAGLYRQTTTTLVFEDVGLIREPDSLAPQALCLTVQILHLQV